MTLKRKERVIINKHLERIKFAGEAFTVGIRKQFENPYTLGTATFIGIAQCLKHNGSIRHGVEGGIVALGVMAAVNGIATVISNINTLSTL